ncbi:ADP-heptose:LPS heptosyltransferase [Mucilaginibacter mallensis]|uniref:ADP-heptose:LPS heptosyltransferase n=1 Tax=Mucilaginibacter mallensis TaxID=652787 RepID=A0A1H1N7G2_MUCMA|nr:glycosyltransferase family 9 protein [Mucilaginibacter mallensis]SDR95051.1 ADP-heptose:LPS heptosyltransferase [Mucilaginibacter mallensis]
MEIKNRNLFRLTRFVIFKISYLFKFLAKFRSGKKRLLILKTDAIGDYILFRNFIEIVKLSDEYKNYEIDLLGNPLWRDIVLSYDAPFVTELMFTRIYDLYEAPLKTFKLGWQLFKRNYAVVLQPSSNRLLITDGLAALTAAKQIIGYEGNTESIQQRYKTKSDKFYTQRLLLPAAVYFEFDRSKFFFEAVLKQKLDINGPLIKTKQTERKGIIIFPGAGIIKRGWEPEKFLELIKLIKQQTNQPVYIAGGPAEAAVAEYLTNALPQGEVINLTGKTTLPQLVELIGSAALVVSNETSAIHIAAAAQTPAICILGGGHFGRFAPYPAHMAQTTICAYEKMECYNCNWNCIYETMPNAPYPCISIVSLDKVWLMAQQALNQL